MGPVAFRPPASACWASCPAGGFPPLSRSAYRTPVTGPDPDGVSAFRACEMRPGWAPPIPRGQRCSHNRRWVSGRRLPPLPAARPYHPDLSFRRSGLTITRHHQGFTCVRPSGLPLARSLPRTERGPMGLFLELRTPSKQDLSGARRGGDRSRTLIRNYAPGITGLQSAHSLNMRDFASHPTAGGRRRRVRRPVRRCPRRGR